MAYIAGLDIGGTKLAVLLAKAEDGVVTPLAKRKFPTPKGGYPPAREAMASALGELLHQAGDVELSSIGISCGGPLDSAKGLILSPPNLPGWDQIPAAEDFSQAFGVPCRLQNDADACALAEWRFGAGRGCQSMVFLTFGTGFGAGLILDGKLYTGASSMAGEIGHCRCPQADGTPYAPVGFGKAGFFEGFCSGGGLAELGRAMALEAIQKGTPPAYCPGPEALESVTALRMAQAAEAGDPVALAAYRCCGRHLGMALSLLMDLLNPERIVIGSVYARSEHLLREAALEVVQREALPGNRAACQVVPAALGDSLGDAAALSVALAALGQGEGFTFAPAAL